jgi:hypothetical protein
MRGEGERRFHQRREIYGKALWVRDDTAVGYDVENLGVGGALLTGGVPLPGDETLRLVLQLDPLPPLEVEARLAWQGDRGYGVDFIGTGADVEEAIFGLLTGHLEEVEPFARPKLASWLP